MTDLMMFPMVKDPVLNMVQMVSQCRWRCLQARRVPLGLLATEPSTALTSWLRTWVLFRVIRRYLHTNGNEGNVKSVR